LQLPASRRAVSLVTLLFIGACQPYRAVVGILTQRDYVDDEMPLREPNFSWFAGLPGFATGV
jgi:hypothetical protein